MSRAHSMQQGRFSKAAGCAVRRSLPHPVVEATGGHPFLTVRPRARPPGRDGARCSVDGVALPDTLFPAPSQCLGRRSLCRDGARQGDGVCELRAATQAPAGAGPRRPDAGLPLRARVSKGHQCTYQQFCCKTKPKSCLRHIFLHAWA